LTEQHQIGKNDKFYKICDDLSLKSKNLYNSCVYKVTQEYLVNNNNIIGNLYHEMKDHPSYKELPTKVAKNVVIDVQNAFKSFFNALNQYQKTPKKFKSRPQIPWYLHKEYGRHVVTYDKQAISKKSFDKKHTIKLSKCDVEVKTQIDDFDIIKCARIVPHDDYYTVEVIYEETEKPLSEDNNLYMGIDLGVNNLATLTSNKKGFKPIIINGKPLKSINQYYNKKRAKISSELEIKNKAKKSKRSKRLDRKRNNKVNDYMHKSSTIIINTLLENGINTLVVGKNDNWKHKPHMSKKNNQNFVSIPHSRLIHMLTYKCLLNGINILMTEDSYTSKSSFIDRDNIPVYNREMRVFYKFSGRRVHRGLYKSRKTGLKMNADVNGSYNIIRKVFPNAFQNVDGIEGLGVVPSIVNLS